MPVVSKSQSRLFHWAAAHPKAAERERGIKPTVAREFVEATHGQRVRDLPEHVGRKAQGGRVSPAAYQRTTPW